MQFTRHFGLCVAGVLLCASAATAQLAISARSGMINYTEGRVLLDGNPVAKTAVEFPQVKEGQELRTTDEGRAEVLLSPGAFLRLSEGSAVKMVSSRLSDTRVQVLAGSVIVEIAEIAKENNITLSMNDAEMTVRKHGVYRLDAADNLIRTYDGEAVIVKAGQSVTLKGGKQLRLEAVLAPEKFNNKVGDAFYRWAARRAEYISMANVVAARAADHNSFTGHSGSWYYNPYFGFFTFLPGSGFYNSFFGPRFYSINAFRSTYYPQPNYSSGPRHDYPTHNPNYGYGTVNSRGSGGYHGSSAPSAPAAAPVASPRGGDGATGRGAGGGRGR
jgi:hypothetical protein